MLSVPLLDAVAKTEGWTGLLQNVSREMEYIAMHERGFSWHPHHVFCPLLTIEHRTCNHMNYSKSSSTVYHNKQEPTVWLTNPHPS